MTIEELKKRIEWQIKHAEGCQDVYGDKNGFIKALKFVLDIIEGKTK